ncbi:MAG: amidohydrolase family protein [Candidatus Bathyarchaeia archaeon]
MTKEFDMVIKNARTRIYPEKLVNIGIKNGIIDEISDKDDKGIIELDAKGNLVTESFINPHLHMCKVYTFQMIGEEALKLYQTPKMGTAIDAIEHASIVKEKYHESWIYENAKKAIMLGLKHGVSHFRAFVDTDTKAKLEGIKASLKLKEEFKGVAELQVVAFPQDGIVRDPGSEELVRKAVEMGADVVGGIPWIEYTDKDAYEHIERMFKIAKEYGKDVAMLTDDAGDPSLRTTEILAVKAIKERWMGRVTACHARAMETYPEPYFRKLVALLKQADISIVSDPHTGPLHAKVKELLKEGVNVALGQDDIADAYYPYGRNNMLEVAFLASHLLWATTIGEMEQLYDMITKNAAKAIGLNGYGLKVGNKANLVVLNVKSPYEALMYQDVPAYVISDGKLIVETESKTVYHL